MSASRSIYVIMPVGSDPLVEEKKSALRAAIEESGREAKFPVYTLDQSSFSVEKLIKEISDSDSVLADLSHERPSCYYELGIVEAIGKREYLIAQAGTKIHQCTNRHSVRYYLNIADMKRIVRIAFMEEDKNS